MLLKDYRLNFLEKLLDLLWSQWTALGVRGNTSAEPKWILDPEALVLFTCNTGRYEPRIFDSMLEWLSINERFLNIQRLKTINKHQRFAGADILPGIASTLVRPATKTKWKSFSSPRTETEESLFLFKNGTQHPVSVDADEAFRDAGFNRKPFSPRNNAASFNSANVSNLILKLRAIFGVNSRSEVISFLLTHEEANATEIASATSYFSKTIYNTLGEMHFSGKLSRRVIGRETLYSMLDDSWETFLLSAGESPKWMNWPAMFRALEIIWTALDNPRLAGEDSMLAASELKLAFHRALPDLQKAVPVLVRKMRILTNPVLNLQELCKNATGIIEYLM